MRLRSWLIYAVVYSFFVSTLGFAEVRKVTREDIEWGNPDNTVTSAGGHVGHYIDNAFKFSSPYVDVRAFMSDSVYTAWVADNTTEVTTSIQAALDDSYTSGKPVFFPAGTWYTDTLNYRGQSMFGVPARNPGESDLGSIIRGKPGKDVFQVTDGSTDVIPNPYIHDLKIYVDGSTDASASFPNRITNGSWAVGNAAFAVPMSDGADPTANLNNATFARLIIEQYPTSGYTRTNKTAAFFFQAPPYQCTFEDVVVHVTEYGYIEAPPVSNPTSYEYAPDSNLYSRVAITSYHGFVGYNGVHGKINDMQIYASGVGNTGFHLLSFTSSVRTYPEKWVVNGLYVEPNSATTGVIDNITGRNHVFVGGDLKADLGSSSWVQWDADYSTMIDVHVGKDDDDTPTLKVAGDGNDINYTTPYNRTDKSSVSDTGYGNRITVRATIYDDSRRARSIGTTRNPLFLLTGEFVDVSPSAPFKTKDDMLFLPEDFNITSGTYALFTITKDNTVKLSQSYFTVASPGNWQSTHFNGTTRLFGQHIPRTKCRVYVYAKAGQTATQVFNILYAADNAGSDTLTSIGGVTMNLTTSWSLQSMDFDFSSVPDGRSIVLGTNSASPNDAAYVAWVAIRPYKDDGRFMGDVVINDNAAGVVMKNAAGTVTKRVRLNDAGDGLIYEAE